ncbi:hypothetical protein [Pseudomonas grimontii]|uniref:hypothetical protein n=1 Tax=Pseudomonas grimontii TaxID=129847 RepID=UPI00216A1C4C|nr:hypothetical protein [Pseudomonas grimontii]MCS3512348.1 enamine deaminase RidA (YjgF/YER057c/UK114 family) [Pseudomonas grimontii]
MTSDEKYQAVQQRLGYQLDEFKVGGNYTPLVRDGNHLYISGQIPRVGDTIMLPGNVGDTLTLAQAQIAAGITVGVMQLPKSAAVEIDMIAVAHG